MFIFEPKFLFWIVYVGNFCSLPTIKMFKNRLGPYNVAILKCFIITWFLDCLLVLQTVFTVENKISWRWRSLKICHKMPSTDTGHRPTAASNKPLQFLLRKLTSWGDYRAIYIVLNISWHFDRFFFGSTFNLLCSKNTSNFLHFKEIQEIILSLEKLNT